MGPIATAVKEATTEDLPDHWANRLNYRTRLHSALVENRIAAGEASNPNSGLRDELRTDRIVAAGADRNITIYRSR